MQPIYRMNGFVTREGNGRAKTNAYISGGMLGKDGKHLILEWIYLKEDYVFQVIIK